jgi:hypothetical protein
LHAAGQITRLLVDGARRLSAQRRGGRQPNTTLDSDAAGGTLFANPGLLLDIDRALDTLRPELVALTESRFSSVLRSTRRSDSQRRDCQETMGRREVFLAQQLATWRRTDGR